MAWHRSSTGSRRSTVRNRRGRPSGGWSFPRGEHAVKDDAGGVTMDLATLEPGHSLFSGKMTISANQVRAYLDAVEDDADVYREEGLAPPMAVAALVMGVAMRAIELPAGAVHTGQELDFVAPVRLGAELDCGATIAQNSVRRGTRFLVLQITGGSDDGPAFSGRASIAIPEVEEGE